MWNFKSFVWVHQFEHIEETDLERPLVHSVTFEPFTYDTETLCEQETNIFYACKLCVIPSYPPSSCVNPN